MARLDIPEDTPAIAPWGQWDRVSLVLIVVLGSLYAAVVLVWGTVTTIMDVASGERLLTLAVNEALPAAADGATATAVDGRLDSATVLASGLQGGTASLLTAGNIIGIVTQLLAVLTFVYLAWRLLRREPFLASLTQSFVVAGLIVILGSIAAQVLTGIGSDLASTELGLAPDVYSLSFDLAAVGFGFMLLLVASAFEYAQKLSAETRGLV